MANNGAGRAGVGIVVLACTIMGLHGLDHPVLGASPADLGGWATWAAVAGPVGLVMRVVRVAALGLSWYLLVASLLAVLARVTRSRGVATLATAVTTAHTRDVVLAVVGTGLLAAVPLDVRVPVATPGVHGWTAAGTGTTAVPLLTSTGSTVGSGVGSGAGSGPEVARSVSYRRDGPGPARTPLHLRRLPASPAPAGEVAMVRLGPDPDPTGTDGPRMHRLDDDRVVGGQRPSDRGPARFTVAAGDHFWRIAEAEVTADRGPDPAERHVRHYWVRLVEANRDLLVDPGNPDLLLPGQVLRLPPLHDGAPA